MKRIAVSLGDTEHINRKKKLNKSFADIVWELCKELGS